MPLAPLARSLGTTLALALLVIGTTSAPALAAETSVGSNLQQIATGVVQAATGSHTLFLKSDGSLWGMGRNAYGQLGDRTHKDRPKPIQIVAADVTSLAAGGDNSLFIQSDGSLWGMGNNINGQLGSPLKNYAAPVKIVSTGVKAVSTSGKHTLFIKTDGSLWGMGNNTYNQLGSSSAKNYTQPIQLVPSGVATALASADYSFFIKTDGSLWAMGKNKNCQLAPCSIKQQITPMPIINSDVVGISANGFSYLVTKSDGSVWAVGGNDSGQLGDGTTTDSQNLKQAAPSDVQVAVLGSLHSLFLKSDHTLWGVGDNEDMQLVNGTTTNSLMPIQVQSDVVAVMANGSQSCFIKQDSGFWCNQAFLPDPSSMQNAASAAAALAQAVANADTAGSHNFDDVTPDAWYAPYFARAYRAGFFNGEYLLECQAADQSCGNLARPNKLMTRAELAQMAANAFYLHSITQATFTDLDNEWYAEAVAGIQAAGITGYADNTFRPTEKVNRIEALAMLLTVANIDTSTAAGGKLPFADTPADAWYARPLAWAVQQGVVNGRSSQQFDPSGLITQAEVVKIILQLQKVAHQQAQTSQ